MSPQDSCARTEIANLLVYALGELAIMYPISGGFYTYSVRFIDPAWGFAMGWNYVFQWAIVLPLELVVAALTMGFWPGAGKISIGVWITVFFVIIVLVNIFGVMGYGEEEFWTSVLKLAAVVIFMLIGLVFGMFPPSFLWEFQEGLKS